jgi:hypothetical protein
LFLSWCLVFREAPVRDRRQDATSALRFAAGVVGGDEFGVLDLDDVVASPDAFDEVGFRRDLDVAVDGDVPLASADLSTAVLVGAVHG